MATVIERGGGLSEALRASSEQLMDLFIRRQAIELRERSVESQERRREMLNRQGFAELLANTSTPGATVGEDPMQQAAMAMLIGPDQVFADQEAGVVDPRFSSLSLNPLSPSEQVIQMRLDTVERLEGSDDPELRRTGKQLKEALLLEPFEVKSFSELNVLDQQNQLASRGLSLMQALTNPESELYDPHRLQQVASNAAGLPVEVRTLVPDAQGNLQQVSLPEPVASTFTSQYWQFISAEKKAQREEWRRLVDSLVDAADAAGFSVDRTTAESVLSMVHSTEKDKAQFRERFPSLMAALEGEDPEARAQALSEVRRTNPELAALVDITTGGLARSEGLWQISVGQLPEHLQGPAKSLLGTFQFISQFTPKENVESLTDAYTDALCEMHKAAGGDCSELPQVTTGLGGLGVGLPWVGKRMQLPEGVARQDAAQAGGTGSPSLDNRASNIRQAADALDEGMSEGDVKAEFGLNDQDMERVKILRSLRGANEQ